MFVSFTNVFTRIRCVSCQGVHFRDLMYVVYVKPAFFNELYLTLKVTFVAHWCFCFSAYDSSVEQVCSPLYYGIVLVIWNNYLDGIFHVLDHTSVVKPDPRAWKLWLTFCSCWGVLYTDMPCLHEENFFPLPEKNWKSYTPNNGFCYSWKVTHVSF